MRDHLCDELVVLGARFSGNDVGDLMHQISVPGCRQTDRLRKHGRVTSARNSMQPFVPPFVVRNAQALNSAAPFIICETFSSSVIRETRSSTRFSIGKGRVLVSRVFALVFGRLAGNEWASKNCNQNYSQIGSHCCPQLRFLSVAFPRAAFGYLKFQISDLTEGVQLGV